MNTFFRRAYHGPVKAVILDWQALPWTTDPLPRPKFLFAYSKAAGSDHS